MISLIDGILISLGIQFVFFIPAYFFQTDKLTDFSYGFTFIILAAVFFVQSSLHILHMILFVMVLVWAARLSGFLYMRIKAMGKDHRFDSMRGNFFKFLTFWIIQGITVVIVLFPALLFFTNDMPDMNGFVIFGFMVWLFGFLVESIADYQKFVFKQDKKNRGTWVTKGLWNYSRHPNYFGEIVLWLGVYLFVVSSLAYPIIGFLSPLFIFVLLRFFSGVPPLEKRYDKKFGKDKDYQKYKKRTNLLVLWFR